MEGRGRVFPSGLGPSVRRPWPTAFQEPPLLFGADPVSFSSHGIRNCPRPWNAEPSVWGLLLGCLPPLLASLNSAHKSSPLNSLWTCPLRILADTVSVCVSLPVC